VFLDRVSIKAGTDWDLELAKAQRAARITTPIISRHFEAAYYLREEITLAIALARHAPGEHSVVPLYLEPENEMLVKPYGLNNKQAIWVFNCGGVEGATKELLSLYRLLIANPTPVEWPEPRPTTHYLHQFPRGPRVPSHLVKRALIEAYASTIPASRAALVLDEAVATRLEADPYDPQVTYVKHAHVLPPETVAPITYWLTVFTEACLQGPRMLAALLSVVDDSQFSPDAKESRRRLLDQLRTSL